MQVVGDEFVLILSEQNEEMKKSWMYVEYNDDEWERDMYLITN